MKKQGKTLFRAIALIMSCVLAVYFLPLHGMVVVAETSPSVTTSPAETMVEATTPSVLCEDESLREENVKHFLMSNHTYRAVVYSTPVHYQKDGKWVDIDNTLTAQAASSDEDFSGQITTGGPFKVKFANNTNSSKLVRIDKDGYRISWAYLSATKRNANGNVKAKVSTNDAALDAVANTSSTITYDYVEENASLQYEVNPTGVKENIVVHSAAATYTYTFEFKTKGVSLNQCEDGSIEAIANDTDEVVFIIPQPFMTDAEGRYSENVTYTLSNVNKNKTTLTVTADANWINSEETVFPVTIDPIILTKQNANNIESTYVASNSSYANTNFSRQEHLRSVGYESDKLGITRTLIKFNLPTLHKGDMVINANLSMRMYRSSVVPGADRQINAHIITQSWDLDDIKWNNQPDYESDATDYSFINAGENEIDYKRFDITRAVKGWYESSGDTNYGILIKTDNESVDARGWFNSEYFGGEPIQDYKMPVIIIEYRNNKGLEDYWTYTSVAAGTAGTMYVNDYTGNPVFVAPLFTSPSELMPLSLYAVYNGYASNLLHVAGKNSSSRTTVARGWRLNVQQTLLPTDETQISADLLERYPYVYTDADGTDHYFIKETIDAVDGYDVYTDEDGLGLTLTFGDTLDHHYYITDKSDNVLVFNSVGNLRRIEDANGNRIAVTYKAATDAYDGGKRIDYVVDGVNHKYTFHYKEDEPENDNVQYVTDHYGRRIVLARVSPSVLAEIRYYDGTVSRFTYTEEEPYSLLSATDDYDYQLRFKYTNKKNGYRVSSIEERSTEGPTGGRLLGQTVSFDRSKHNTTVIRTSGSDDIHDTNDDILTTCIFDDVGRLTSSYTKTATGTFVGAGVSRYTDVSDANTTALNQQNRLLTTASFGRNITDYITNSGFETNWSGWTDASIDADATFEVSNNASYFGKKSAKISVDSVTAQTGRAMYSQDITGLTPGDTYTFSAYVKTEDMEKVYTGSHDGAFLRLYTQDSDTPTNAYSEHIAEDTDTAFDKGWKRLTATITLPDDCTEVRAYIQLRNMTGTVYVDGAQLEKGEYAHPVNLLENAGFSKYSSGVPTTWTAAGFSGSNDGVTSAQSQDGGYSLRLVGDDSKEKTLSQTIPVSGNPNETYIISGWAKGRAVSSVNHSNAKYEISVSVKYKKSNGTYHDEDKPAVLFNPTVSGWQYAAQAFPLVPEDEDGSVPVSITVSVRFDYQANTVFFDKLQLLRENANTYTYDEDGNVVSASANAEQKSKMIYDGPDLLSVSDNKGYDYEYMYDYEHNVSFGKSAGDVYTTYDRNANGQIISVNVEDYPWTTNVMQTISYTGQIGNVQPGAHVATVADANAQVTNYFYDDLERTAAVVGPNGIASQYTYKSTSNDRVSRVAAVNTTNNSTIGAVWYAYDGNRLSSLTYGSDTYEFNVDRFGNATSTTINGKTLSTNAYASKNGKLSSVTYGNGDVRTYAYNWRGQTIGIHNGSHYIYRYIYDLNGKLTEFIDNLASRKMIYTQDSLGRPVRQALQTLEGAHIGAVDYGYDERNNVNRLSVNFGGHTHTAKYEYEAIDDRPETERYEADNLPTRYEYAATRYADYSYDGINRLTSRTFSTVTPLVNTYTYCAAPERNVDGFTSYQTNQLHTETINGIIYQYTYDVAGNITLVKKGTAGNLVNYREYTYDGLSQLISETYYDSTGTVAKTISYTYDSCGNILSRTVNGDTVNYTYGTDTDAGWSKLLKSYDGQSIDYDEIGNPLSYRGADLAWGNGRQLKRFENDDVAVAYAYDDAGMRTRKTVNGAESTYLYVDGKLHGEVRDGHHIHYSYDSYGNLSVIKYYTNDTNYYTYYVMTNAFGDVVSLHDLNGTTKATYEYDSWGNVISMTDTTGIGIATINPIRYRGYFYDAETGLYYLSSRYYDPQVGRFINADGYVSTGQGVLGHNMFAYCNDNPIIYFDDSGMRPIASMVVGDETEAESTASFNYMRKVRQTPYIPTSTISIDDITELRIDTDGHNGDYGSLSHQKHTSFCWTYARYDLHIAADEIPYVVVPDDKDAGKWIGCLAKITDYEKGTSVYAIVADAGPVAKGFGEVSLKAAWSLGYSKSEANGTCGPSGHFGITIYNIDPPWQKIPITFDEIQRQGRKIW